MSRPIPWFWFVLAALLLLLPMPIGRFLLDLAGGLTLLLFLLPLLAGGAAWIAWQVMRSRLKNCPACGTASFATEQCPLCGASMQVDVAVAPRSAQGMAFPTDEIQASDMTITIDAVEVRNSSPD